jgi:hypothetical protein
MAEAIDRPAGSEQQGTSAPGVPPGLPEPEVYQPLSLPALAGFGLAVVYAALLVVSSLVALFTRTPLLLPGALFLVPLAAAAVCWIGRNQIRASEGTRGGSVFASWGIGLSLVCGLLYACYCGGTYFAVRQQAAALAEQWLDLLRNDEVARAYRLTITPAFRPADNAALVGELQQRFNDEGTRGITWDHFRQGDLVGLFHQARRDVQVQPLGVADWDYDKGSYVVKIRYRIATPYLAGDLVVALSGSKAPAGEYEGREWQVLAEGTHLQPETMKRTPEGEQRMQAAMMARMDAEKWTRFFTSGQDLDAAWLATLPASQRAAASRVKSRRQVYAFPALTGAAVLGAVNAADHDFVLSRQAFDAGSLVRCDPKTFPPKIRANPEAMAQMVQAVRQMFSSGPRRRMGRLSLSPTRLPTWEEKDGVVWRVPLPGQITVMDEARTGPQFSFEVTVVVEADPTGAGKPQSEWRIRFLDLVGVRPAPPRNVPGAPGMPTRGAPPGPPGAQRPSGNWGERGGGGGPPARRPPARRFLDGLSGPP